MTTIPIVSDLLRCEPSGRRRAGPLTTRGTQPSSDITDRGFTGHRENRDIGLTYMNARYYVGEIGRFASADTLVPDPLNPQSFNRYSYGLNNPMNITDPSGHCHGTAGDGVNDDCWNYLMGTGVDSFCQGAGINICGAGDWTQWLVAQRGMYAGAWTFDVAWNRHELETLGAAIAAMIDTLGQAGIAWENTPLRGTTYSKNPFPLANPWTNPLTRVVHLVTVYDQVIWHETAHSLDFGSMGSLNDRFAMASGNCTNHGMGGNLCGNMGAEGYYYRDYGWNAGEEYGSIYGAIFNQHETFADAFAARMRVTDADDWKRGRALDKEYTVHWREINNAVDVVLSDAFN